MIKQFNSAPRALAGYLSYETMTREQMIEELKGHLERWKVSVGQEELSNFCAPLLDQEIIRHLDLMRGGIASQLIYQLAPRKEWP